MLCHNVHTIHMYVFLYINIMDNLHAGGHSDRGTLSPSTPAPWFNRYYTAMFAYTSYCSRDNSKVIIGFILYLSCELK